MTIQMESTICTLVQSYPILLILAQNHNKCLKTPFIYKPPTPTQSPEYYEALEALFQNLFGHGYHGNEHGCGYDGYGKNIGQASYAYPCHPYGHAGYDVSHYGHGISYPNTKYPNTYGAHSYGTKYPVTYANPSYGTKYPVTYANPSYGTKYPVTYANPAYGIKYPGSYGTHSKYPGLAHGYPATNYDRYPTLGYKKLSVYNASGTPGYKGTYAPTQVYNMNHKYKIVVKKNKIKKRRRPHKIQEVQSK